MIVIAHRGASGYAPEHTFASWDLAVALGADYLEQDLQMTRDGVLVVMHDETLDRTARRDGQPCTGRVIDYSLAELLECDVGSWYDDRFSGERLPTLEQVVKRYPDANLYIETKNPEEAPGMEESLLDLLDRYGLLDAARKEWKVLIQSFSAASLRKIHDIEPGLPLIQLLHRGFDPVGSMSEYMNGIAGYAIGIGPHFSDVNEPLIKATRAACLHVHPYTVDDPDEMDRLAGIGVDGIFTNVADRLLAKRPATEPRGGAAAAAAAQGSAHCRESTSQS